MTANRLCEPESKLDLWDRWLSTVYMPSCEGFKLDHMYKAIGDIGLWRLCRPSSSRGICGFNR